VFAYIDAEFVGVVSPRGTGVYPGELFVVEPDLDVLLVRWVQDDQSFVAGIHVDMGSRRCRVREQGGRQVPEPPVA
jgi:hypothetical protein